jgi:hypothetical protein
MQLIALHPVQSVTITILADNFFDVARLVVAHLRDLPFDPTLQCYRRRAMNGIRCCRPTTCS